MFMKSHLVQFSIAFMLCLGLINGQAYYTKSVLEHEPISKWYEVLQLAVPNYRVNEETVSVIYDRLVHRAFESETTIRVQNLNDKTLITECVRHIKEKYSVSNIKIERAMLLQDLIGDDCKPKVPGIYRLAFLMNIDRGNGLKIVQLAFNSEIFEVKDTPAPG